MSEDKKRDLIIIGGGPAGLSAAIYAARAGREPLVINGPEPGGQITTTDELENSLKNKMDATPVEPVSEDQISELNSEYEKKMAAIKEVDAANNQLAILSEIEEMVRLSIEDMLEHVSNLETNIGEKLDTEAIYADLKVKIETIKSEYKS